MSSGKSNDRRGSFSRRFHGGSRIKPAYFKPKPVSIGDEVTVVIEGLSRRGDGVAKIRGYVIFVPNTRPGDRVKIKIVLVKPGFAVGELIGKAI